MILIDIFQSNWTPLMIAVSAGRNQIVNDLLSKGAQVNAVNKTGQCSLHYAASKDRYEVPKLRVFCVWSYLPFDYGFSCWSILENIHGNKLNKK